MISSLCTDVVFWWRHKGEARYPFTRARKKTVSFATAILVGKRLSPFWQWFGVITSILFISHFSCGQVVADI